MQFSIMWQLALVHFILFVLQVVVCALLLRERGLGVWLMLAGSVVGMGDHFLFHITPFLPNMPIGGDLGLAFSLLGLAGEPSSWRAC
jgi:hypothetical protein